MTVIISDSNNHQLAVDVSIVNNPGTDHTLKSSGTATLTIYATENATVTLAGNTIHLKAGANTLKVDVSVDTANKIVTEIDVYINGELLASGTWDTGSTTKITLNDGASHEVTLVNAVAPSVTDSTPALYGAAFTDFNDVKDGIFGDMNDAWVALRSVTNFGIIALQDADNSLKATTPTLTEGDIAVLTIDVSGVFDGFAPGSHVTGQVVPEHGAAGVIDFTTPPSTYTQSVMELQ